MRIGVLTGIFHPDPGGPSTYLYHLLPELIARGHTIELLAFGAPQPGDADYGYPVTRIAGGRIRRTWAYYRAASRIAARSDVLFVHTLATLMLPLLRLRFRRKIVIKVVGDWSWEMAGRRGMTSEDELIFQTSRKPVLLRLIRAYYLYAVRRADAVIVPSKHLQAIVLRWGVDPARVQVIYNAIPATDLHTVARDRLRRELGLPLDRPIMVSVSRLTPRKGVQVAMAALDDLPGVLFVVVGEGHQRAELEAMSPPGQVLFPGAQPHDAVLRYLRAADVYVLSSFTEGLSHTLLEAVAVGTPCVATSVGGNPEVITHGVDGLLIPPGDPAVVASAVRRLLDDPELAARISAAAVERSADFRWDNEVMQTVEALEAR